MFGAVANAIGNPFGDGAIIGLLIGVATFVTVLIVWFGLIEPRQLQTRIKSLKDRRDQMAKAQSTRSTRSTGHPMRDKSLEAAQGLVEKFRLFQGTQTQALTDMLAQAGFRSRDALILFLAARFALPILFGMTAIIFVYLLGVPEMPSMMKLVSVVFATGFGFYGPRIYVSNESQKRRKKLQKAMPDGLDLMVICAEAGLSLDATMTRVSRELKTTWPELSDEVNHTSLEIGFLPERRMALENLTKRVALPHMRALVNTLLQTERYGTPLAHALRVLASEMRVNRLMVAEEKAARLPAVLTVPMILFILPALFVVLIGPAVLQVIDQLRAIT
jgi:tight adherence protein C